MATAEHQDIVAQTVLREHQAILVIVVLAVFLVQQVLAVFQDTVALVDIAVK